MRFLADESWDFAVVRARRAAGHDVVAIAESRHGITDRDVMELAEIERRVVITEDKDFGQLAFAGERQGDRMCAPAVSRECSPFNRIGRRATRGTPR